VAVLNLATPRAKRALQDAVGRRPVRLARGAAAVNGLMRCLLVERIEGAQNFDVGFVLHDQ